MSHLDTQKPYRWFVKRSAMFIDFRDLENYGKLANSWKQQPKKVRKETYRSRVDVQDHHPGVKELNIYKSFTIQLCANVLVDSPGLGVLA